MQDKYSAQKSAYAAKLRDPRWQKKRLAVLERDGWQCQTCGDSEKTLHVHHNTYSPWFNDPWLDDLDVLVTLCSDCHAEGHDNSKDAIYCLLSILGACGVRSSRDVFALDEAVTEAVLSDLETPKTHVSPEKWINAFVTSLTEFRATKEALIRDGKWWS